MIHFMADSNRVPPQQVLRARLAHNLSAQTRGLIAASRSTNVLGFELILLLSSTYRSTSGIVWQAGSCGQAEARSTTWGGLRIVHDTQPLQGISARTSRLLSGQATGNGASAHAGQARRRERAGRARRLSAVFCGVSKPRALPGPRSRECRRRSERLRRGEGFGTTRPQGGRVTQPPGFRYNSPQNGESLNRRVSIRFAKRRRVIQPPRLASTCRSQA